MRRDSPKPDLFSGLKQILKPSNPKEDSMKKDFIVTRKKDGLVFTVKAKDRDEAIQIVRDRADKLKAKRGKKFPVKARVGYRAKAA